MSYTLASDHAEMKKDIKAWELSIDHLLDMLYEVRGKAQEDEDILRSVVSGLETLSDEMMAVNI